jgi:hypothetical protein
MAPAATRTEPKLVRLINPETGVIFDYSGHWLRPGKATMTDVRKGWARFPGDKVWLSLPPGVQKQLEAGKLQVLTEHEAREAIGDSQALAAMMPRGNAAHSAWLEFAVAQGMDRREAEGLTRDQIRARFAEPVLMPEAASEAGGDGQYEVLN